MGQVPDNNTTYLIIGKGRLASHFKHYFTLMGVPYLNWYRNCNNSFDKLYERSGKILVLINDDAIESFIKQHKRADDKVWIHCSGMLTTPLAESAHPLMTFADKLYDLQTYEQVTFVTEKEKLSFTQLFPKLNNQHFAIPSAQKALYHAWAVMGGNFTTLLWKWYLSELESKFGIDKEAAHQYLKQITDNLMHSSAPLTGPLARNDKKVISKHLNELNGTPYRKLYEAFVNTFNELNNREGGSDIK